MTRIMRLLIVFRKEELEHFPNECKELIAYLDGHYENVLTAFSGFRHERDSLTPSCPDNLTNGQESVLKHSDDIDIVLVSASHRIPSMFLWESVYAEYVFSKRPLVFLSHRKVRKLIEKASCRERRFGK